MCSRIRSSGIPRSAWLSAVHVLLGPAAALGRIAAAVVGQDLDQPRVVHLQQETGLDDREVLRPHGFGHRGQVILLGGVVLVAAEPAGAGGRQEGLGHPAGHLGIGQRGAQVGDVGGQRGLAGVADRAGADHHPHRRHRRGVLRHVGVVVLGEVVDLLLPGRRQQRLALHLVEAGQPLLDVGEEGDLALLAVGDHVQARHRLAAHHVQHRVADHGLEGGRVIGPAVLLLPHHLKQAGRAGQAADVRSQDALRAALHESSGG